MRILSYTCIATLLLVSRLACAATDVQTALQGALQEARKAPGLDALYRAEGYRLLWSTNGEATKQAAGLIQALKTADALGLRPTDYDTQGLTDALALLQRNTGDMRSWVSFEVRLSTALLAYVNDLHFGRIDPRTAGTNLAVERSRLDLPSAVASLSRSGDVAASLRSLEPQFHHYELLKQALVRYRELASDPSLTALAPLPARSVKPGDSYAGASRLQRLLIALGDLQTPSTAAADIASLTPTTVEGLKRFQERHGLAPDGVLGPATWRDLTRPLSERVRQIELTLERWRWLPSRLEGPSIFINIPQFKLFAFSGVEDRAADMIDMDVVVGETVKRNHTPVFVADMTHLIIRPYWDVPHSIAVRELLPQIHQDPDYIDKNQLEIVGRSGGPLPADPGNLQAIAAGTLRLRQRPGPDNALGLVKFMLPNPHHVYLHDTPARALFARNRRAFSHGCIRLSDAAALAEYVLRDNPAWTRERLAQAMNGKESLRINLSHPIRVFIVYGTVIARERGDVLFFEDLYGQDAQLARLLDKR